MISDLIQTPEFAAPLPRWVVTASLALNLLLIALLVDLPAHDGTDAAALTAAAATR